MGIVYGYYKEHRLIRRYKNQWFYFPSHNNRTHRPIFSSNGLPGDKPAALERVSIYQRGSYIICSGVGRIADTPTRNEQTTLWNNENQEDEFIWYTKNLEGTEAIPIIGQAIQNGTAVVVSNGSFQDTYAIAALILEDLNTGERKINKEISPGASNDVSAYRAELTGIFSAIRLVNNLCQKLAITSGYITLGCDGLSALQKTLETNPVIQLSEPNFDLLAAIKKEIKASPLVWEYQYIEGHQDDHKASSELEKWSQMNVEADALAKGLIPIAKTSPRHFCIPNEPWSIWFSSKKLLQLQTQIYDIVHSPEARAYWQEKDKIPRLSPILSTGEA